MSPPLPGLTRSNVGLEALSGVTLVAIAVPLNIGYAQIAGLPPTAGLYALVVPAVLYALTVSSRQVVASPDAAAAALVASSVGGLAVAGSADYLSMALAQAIISGLMFVACSVLKLGFLATFLSKPILVGFVGGLALDILVSQLAKMLGVRIESGDEFVDKVGQLVAGLDTVNWICVVISSMSLAILLVGRRLNRSVPWALVVLVVTTLAVVWADLASRGVSVLGKVEAGPPQLTVPQLELTVWLSLVPSALALTMVTMAEGLLVSRSYGAKNGYATDPNRDLAAFGVGNIASGLTGGFAVGSSTSRTAAMDQAGSRTQLPSIVAAALALLLLVFGTAVLEDIPSPAIGAVVAVAVFPLLGIPELRELWDLNRFELGVAAACFLGTLLLGPIPGIFIAFVLALVNLARRAASPAVDVLGAEADADHALTPLPTGRSMTVPGVVVMRFAAPIFFANVGQLDESIHAAVEAAQASPPEDGTPLAHLVLDMEAVTDIDVTGAEGFGECRTWLAARGVQLHYSRVRPRVAVLLGHYGLDEGTTAFGTNRAAIEALTTEVDSR
ncbi:SulP family inorganic anion transporter [Fodinibacter luteus]|uniref:SulP family inorganic anion transporter n=1 Tax=Fodinibacter luteus TaxID=552064 RepID=A0ABP8KLA4_9MICO